MTTTTVSNTADLLKALGAAHDGDTIALAAGTYSNVNLYSVKFAGNVTITSADSSNPAVISGLDLGGSSGLTFSHLKLQYSDALGNAVYAGNSSNIVFDSDEILGSPTNRVGTGIFLQADDHITIKNSNLHDLEDGIAHLDSNYVTVTNNQIHDMSNDGVRGGGSSYVTISNNTFTNFHPEQYAHNDAIQFWTTNTSTSAHDIVVTNNTMIRGDTGTPTQGIFMGNENDIAYQNVTITGNTLIGEAYQGIQLDMANNFVVSNNLVDGYTDMTSWIEVQQSTNGTVTGNSATSFIFSNNTGVALSGNQFIQQSAVGDMSDYNSWTQTGKVPTSVVTGSADNMTSAPSSGNSTAGSTPSAPVADSSPWGTVSTGISVVDSGTGNQTLNGTTGNDTLSDGGHGGDVLQGGNGDDLYIINNASTTINSEGWTQGNDTVQTTLSSYSLAPGIENLKLAGTSFQTGYASFSSSTLTGNGVSYQLVGGSGNDTLVDNGGSATLTGGAGSDVFQFTSAPSSPAVITDFTHGQDVLQLHGLISDYHGTNPIADGWVKLATSGGDTTIYVDSDGPGSAHSFVAAVTLKGVTSIASTDWDLGTVGTAPTSPPSGGTTTTPPPASDSYTSTNPWTTASAGIERIDTSTGPQTLNGTMGADTLVDGGHGGDVLQGGNGDDLYIINNAGTTINSEGWTQGTDTVQTTLSSYTLAPGIENLKLAGASFQTGYASFMPSTLTGNGVSYQLVGGSGNDTLVDNGGSATLTGGAGSDVFQFTTTPSSPAVITDFKHGQDKLDLHSLLSNYHGSNPVADGWLKLSVAGGSTTVMVDVDGSAAAHGFIAVAKLAGVTNLASSDWII